MITIRPARKTDIPGIDALLARSYPRQLKADYAPSILVTVIPLISKAQPALIMSGTYYVAVDDTLIVGAGGWTPRRDGEAEVRHFVTDDRRLRQGIARSLMMRCIETATRGGRSRLHCAATRTAVPFYSAMGFEVIGPMNVPLGPARIAFPAIEMSRALGTTGC